jgi:hypothetical protein
VGDSGPEGNGAVTVLNLAVNYADGGYA